MLTGFSGLSCRIHSVCHIHWPPVAWKEVATWDDEGLFRLFEFDLDTETFSDAYVLRACLRKDQVDIEVTVFDFRNDFGDPERVLFVLPGDGGG